ncbi:TolC family protein [Candidatus Methylobacter oryzae]|uniref:TolC family protein n=1 Tax=Candidatus Methylobacter oryzae TaxID=2497749 RepID=UPI00240D0F49|nr:TolC family protein [Candidatus Methylobacter oryzae]
MKTRIFYPFGMSLLLIAFSGCSLNTNLSIPEKAIPASFKNQKSGTSMAGVKWRQYFADVRLQKLIDTAISNNIDLQIALQRIEMSRSSVKLANGALLPKVSLNVEAVSAGSGSIQWMGPVTPVPKSHPAKPFRSICPICM